MISMSTSRRDLITKGALAATGALISVPDILQAAFAKPLPKLPVKAAPKKPAGTTDTLPWLSRPLLAPRVGQTFHIYWPGRGWVATRLLRVEDVSCAAAAGTVNSPDCFTAVFDSSVALSIPQGTYSVNNAGLGTFTLFLVPGGHAGRRPVYTATVNRVRA
jgi:hypothetical protein